HAALVRSDRKRKTRRGDVGRAERGVEQPRIVAVSRVDRILHRDWDFRGQIQRGHRAELGYEARPASACARHLRAVGWRATGVPVEPTSGRDGDDMRYGIGELAGRSAIPKNIRGEHGVEVAWSFAAGNLVLRSEYRIIAVRGR